MPFDVLLPDLPGRLRFTAKLLDKHDASTHTGSGKNRPSLLVYTAVLFQKLKCAASNGSGSTTTFSDTEVVVKIPGSDQLIRNEVSYVR